MNLHFHIFDWPKAWITGCIVAEVQLFRWMRAFPLHSTTSLSSNRSLRHTMCFKRSCLSEYLIASKTIFFIFQHFMQWPGQARYVEVRKYAKVFLFILNTNYFHHFTCEQPRATPWMSSRTDCPKVCVLIHCIKITWARKTFHSIFECGHSEQFLPFCVVWQHIVRTILFQAYWTL